MSQLYLILSLLTFNLHLTIATFPPRGITSSSKFKFTIKGAYIESVNQFNNDSLVQYQLTDGTIVDLFTEQLGPYLTRYYLIWYGGGPNGPNREICLHYGATSGQFWYPTYYSANPEFPLDPTRTVERIPFGYLNDPGVVRSEYADVLEQLFLRSDGFAVLPAARQPLFLRRDPNRGDPQLCFSVQNTWPYNEDNVDPRYLDIKLHLFSASTISEVTDYVIHKSGLISKPTSTPPESYFRNPSWSSWNQPSSPAAYPGILVQHGFKAGQILINEKLAPNLIPTSELGSVVAEAHQLGFQIGLFREPQISGRIVSSQIEPYFTRYRQTESRTSWIDFSNSKAVEWYRNLYENLKISTSIDSFILLGTQEPVPVLLYNTTFNDAPQDRTAVHFEAIGSLGMPMIVHQAFKTQHLPAFLQLTSSTYNFSQYLESFLSGILSVSIGGYSWISPKPVGALPNPPNEEMYIRWIQAITFLPHITIYTSPWMYSEYCNNITRKFLHLHASYTKLFLSLATERLTRGSPIIRPLWYTEPFNPNTFKLNDQFMLGSGMVVAPILRQGQRFRRVFLPTGIWSDQQGREYVGAGWFTVSAPIEELPYFIRI